MPFSVIFEVKAKPEHWNTYVGAAQILRPISESIPGYIENIRYRSLTREGYILSLSTWATEKALIRWRTTEEHHKYQEMGRNKLLLDYYLRVGQNVDDSSSRQASVNGLDKAQSLDETEVGDATTLLLLNTVRPLDWAKATDPKTVAKSLGLQVDASGLVQWDVFDGVLDPGHVIALSCWKNEAATLACKQKMKLSDGVGLRHVRILRDYGMFDRREAPQYYPDAEGRPTLH